MATNTAIDGFGPVVMLNGKPGSSPSINASKNVSSLTRQSTGNYTINFTNSLADANYVLGGMGQNGSSTGGYIGIDPGTTPGTGSVQIQNLNNSATLTDTGNILSVIIFPL